MFYHKQYFRRCRTGAFLVTIPRKKKLSAKSKQKATLEQSDIRDASRFQSSATMASGEPKSPVWPSALPTIPSSPRFYRRHVDRLSDLASQQNDRFALDIEWKVVGLMPPNLFLETFLPRRTRVPLFSDVTFSGVPCKPSRESEIYPPMVSGAVSSSHRTLNTRLVSYLPATSDVRQRELMTDAGRTYHQPHAMNTVDQRLPRAPLHRRGCTTGPGSAPWNVDRHVVPQDR